MQNNIIEMRGIEKSFNKMKVVNNADFTLRKGEIHSLLGENGAGKTTLMNILYGLYRAEKGTIFFDGEIVNFSDPIKAISHGIGMVHQHFMLVDTMTVYENIILGDEECKLGFLRRNESQKRIERIMEDTGLHVDLNAKISTLPIGVKQRVEIIKALYRNVRVLILDEPTAVLTPQETDELFLTLRRLKQAGTSIVLITHKLRETYAIADRITVMRRGIIVSTNATDEIDSETLVQNMVGRQIGKSEYPHDQSIGQTVLRAEHISTDLKVGTNLKDICFQVKAGEILGFAGVDGNGQSALSDILIGVIHPNEGTLTLNGQKITNNTPSQQIDAGVAVIPEDRNAMGLVPAFSVTENLMLGLQNRKQFQKNGFLRYSHAELAAKSAVEKYSLLPARTDLPAKGFSGGNQQKIIIARELEQENLQLVLACQPTRGLDIGATEFVHKQLIRMRDEGKAIILISTELDEVLSLSDRIAVLFEGKILATRPTNEYTIETLGFLMAGQTGEEG